jgi:hypothetical protein
MACEAHFAIMLGPFQTRNDRVREILPCSYVSSLSALRTQIQYQLLLEVSI